MNEKALALATFFLTIVTFTIIRFVFRLKKIRKTQEKLPVVLYADALDVLLCCGESGCGECGCGCLSSADAVKDYVKQETEDYDSRKHEPKPPIGKRRGYKIRKRQESRKDRERSKVIRIASAKEKTNIDWVVKKASLPKERVIEILKEEPDFTVDDAYVINKKLLAKDEQAHLYEMIREKHAKEEKEQKLAIGICPECNKPIEEGSDRCSFCNYKFKK
ncbi:MAG: hypothetical protein ACTSPC_05770 [Candidatus Heimdallarchaeota archaeon]